METAVALVGWVGSTPRRIGSCERVPAATRALGRLRSRRLVVLGDAALAALDPTSVASVFRGSDARLLLCPLRCPYELLIPWLRTGVGTATTTTRLTEDAERAFTSAARPRLPPDDWLGRPVPDAIDAALALAALDGLDRFTVDAWADALGHSRHRLLRTCERQFGAAASEVLWRYVAAVARRMRADGAHLARIADALGYSETSALVRAFRRRGERLDGALPTRPATPHPSAGEVVREPAPPVTERGRAPSMP